MSAPYVFHLRPEPATAQGTVALAVEIGNFQGESQYHLDVRWHSWCVLEVTIPDDVTAMAFKFRFCDRLFTLPPEPKQTLTILKSRFPTTGQGKLQMSFDHAAGILWNLPEEAA